MLAEIFRGTPTIDLSIVVEELSESRFERLKIFDEVEEKCKDDLKSIEYEYDMIISFSPILKTVEEATNITPLYLDLVEDGVILYDRRDFLKNILEKVKARLSQLGAKRVWRGRRWYWILKPDIKIGEVIEI